MRWIAVIAALAVLAGCGGSNRTYKTKVPATRVSSGPVASACMASGRKSASRQLCGCVQFVADISLTPADQKQAVEFFRDPHRAQEIRQSDGNRHEAFWARYKAFAGKAETLCEGA